MTVRTVTNGPWNKRAQAHAVFHRSGHTQQVLDNTRSCKATHHHHRRRRRRRQGQGRRDDGTQERQHFDALEAPQTTFSWACLLLQVPPKVPFR